ncbi:MAG: diadenylate cyclase [Janthinobacterium lividum]
MGLTEATDAIVLVVSEETGQVSLVRQGEIHRNLTPLEVKSRLGEWLHPGGLAATAT